MATGFSSIANLKRQAVGGKTLPLTPGASVGTNIKEFRGGKTFAHTLHKFGAKRAQAQAVAVAMKESKPPRRKVKFPRPDR